MWDTNVRLRMYKVLFSNLGALYARVYDRCHLFFLLPTLLPYHFSTNGRSVTGLSYRCIFLFWLYCHVCNLSYICEASNLWPYWGWHWYFRFISGFLQSRCFLWETFTVRNWSVFACQLIHYFCTPLFRYRCPWEVGCLPGHLAMMLHIYMCTCFLFTSISRLPNFFN